MPNGGPVVRAPQLEGSKPKHLMNVIDREGLGRYVLEKAHEGLSTRKISDAILADFGVYVGYRTISGYIEPFKDPTTGQLTPMNLIPKVPDRNVPKTLAQTLHDILEEQQIDDVTVLETLASQGLAWFKDVDLPVTLRLKVAKELRETIKLKMELGGVVKPTAPVNNTMIMGTDAMEKLLSERPDMVPLFREFLYLASGRADIPVEPMDVKDL